MAAVYFYVSRDDPFMSAAEKIAKQFSTELNHPTGAVVVKDGKIIGEGANQAAFKHRSLAELHKKYFCARRWLKIPSGQKYWLCPGCAQYRHHAEVRAVRDALAKHPREVSGADLYLWGHWWCCEPCWRAIIAAQIRDVYLLANSYELFASRR